MTGQAKYGVEPTCFSLESWNSNSSAFSWVFFRDSSSRSALSSLSICSSSSLTRRWCFSDSLRSFVADALASCNCRSCNDLSTWSNQKGLTLPVLLSSRRVPSLYSLGAYSETSFLGFQTEAVGRAVLGYLSWFALQKVGVQALGPLYNLLVSRQTAQKE